VFPLLSLNSLSHWVRLPGEIRQAIFLLFCKGLVLRTVLSRCLITMQTPEAAKPLMAAAQQSKEFQK
jgi:hypothetical protein